jgi:hypothetical protein
MQPRHVLDWSTASVEWTVNGFELTVSLQQTSTARLVNAITAALGPHLAMRHRDVEVLAYEPDGADPPAIGVVSTALLELDPQRLRYDLDSIADTTANTVLAESARDDAAIANWVAGLRE